MTPALNSKSFKSASTLEILRSAAFHDAVNQLSGYSAACCGDMLTLKEAFPDFKPRRRLARSE